MSFQFNIPTEDGGLEINFEAGETVIFVGANGGGKTRLTVHIEDALAFKAHRISAHRALSLNANVQKISEDNALAGLRTGVGNKDSAKNTRQRDGNRWGRKKATSLLNDYNFLLQALFADQANKGQLALDIIYAEDTDIDKDTVTTQFRLLKKIWNKILPHRKLEITGDNIEVSISNVENSKYDSGEMSDGERAIFYMIGQVLVAEKDSVIIIDEPELHMHKSIMAKLWDELEAARSDCGFVFVTHDLDFAAARKAQKYIIRGYLPAPYWEIEPIPMDTGFSEEITTLILGSRKPILFVEGTGESLDLAIYRACYPEWTVVPRASCLGVIQSVTTMRNNAELTRITCSGIVDGDDFSEDEKLFLKGRGIEILPVSEIENLLLLPDVCKVILTNEGYCDVELSEMLRKCSDKLIDSLNTVDKIERVVVRYTQRRIDRILKKIDLSEADTIVELVEKYDEKLNSLNVANIAAGRKKEIEDAITERDLPKILILFDDKGMLASVSGILKSTNKNKFESWIIRSLTNNSCKGLKEVFSAILPVIEVN